MTENITIQKWNADRAEQFRIRNYEDIIIDELDILYDLLKESYIKLETVSKDIIAFHFSRGILDDPDSQHRIFKIIQKSLQGKPSPFIELRHKSHEENTIWHIHLISVLEKNKAKRRKLTFSDIGLNCRAFTLNMSLTGPSTLFTTPKNISYEYIDFDFDLEENPHECSLGNLVNSRLEYEENIFQPNTGTLMLFRDNIIHKSPSIDSERSYIIAGNVPFTVEYDATDPEHLAFPRDLLERCRLFS